MAAILKYFSPEQVEAFLKFGPTGFAALMLILAAIGMVREPSKIKALLLAFFMVVGAFCFVVAVWASRPPAPPPGPGPGITAEQVATLEGVLKVDGTALEEVKQASALGLAGCRGGSSGVPLFHASEFSTSIAALTGDLSQIRGQVQQALNGPRT